jgi:hypothetical protein
LVDASDGVIKHLDLDGWEFPSYSRLLNNKLITPEIQPRSTVNSSLLLVANLNYTKKNLIRSDGFVAQLISFMFTQNFLYYFGRVKTLLWTDFSLCGNLLAYPGHFQRKKVTVMREMTSDLHVVAGVKKTELLGKGDKETATREYLKSTASMDVLDLDRSHFLPPVLHFINRLTFKTSCVLIDLTPLGENKANSAPVNDLKLTSSSFGRAGVPCIEIAHA